MERDSAQAILEAEARTSPTSDVADRPLSSETRQGLLHS
jgi:hypothetical protein